MFHDDNTYWKLCVFAILFDMVRMEQQGKLHRSTRDVYNEQKAADAPQAKLTSAQFTIGLCIIPLLLKATVLIILFDPATR